MRLFVGLALSPGVTAELLSVVERLRTSDDGLRWSTPDWWHITLQFLGNTSAEKYECVTAQLGGVHAGGVPVRLGDLGLFDRAGVFFAGVMLSPELVALERKVAAATGPCGFAAESRAYHPHITLARVKGAGRSHGLAKLRDTSSLQPAFTPFVAEEFLLYESVLERTGARYEVRKRFALN
jgi:2'-5' RNA ligase